MLASPAAPPPGDDGAAAHAARIFHNDLVVVKEPDCSVSDTDSKHLNNLLAEKLTVTEDTGDCPPTPDDSHVHPGNVSPTPTAIVPVPGDGPVPKNHKGDGPKLPLVNRSTKEGEFHTTYPSEPTPMVLENLQNKVRTRGNTNADLPTPKRRRGKREREMASAP